MAILLILNAVFNFITWPTFFRRVVKDPRARGVDGKPTAFFTVHLVLFIVGVTLGAVSLLAGVLSLIGVW